ncbi:MAG: carbamate kinase [Actinomycetota bacterium]
MRIVIALGGNALLKRGERPDASIQLAHLDSVAPAIARLAADHDVIIVHGNGPQVGLLANESAADPALRSPYPLADLVAETQGLIGSWIQRSLTHAGLTRDVIVLVSRTLVNHDDPAFHRPAKFIGPMLDADQARRARAQGRTIAMDGESWRQVVPSPTPVRVLETARASQLLDAGCTVVLAGGGGIPVDQHGDAIDAVVDKDLTAARIAVDLEAELLVILTDVDGVMRDFGTSGQTLIRATTSKELSSQQFADGSMGPKVRAVSQFTSATGRRSAIGRLDELTGIIVGTAGTQVHAEAVTAAT